MTLFVECNVPLVSKLRTAAAEGTVLDMETEFCSLSLDIIGKAVFNYDFGSVSKESPVVKAVYRVLQEAEHRSTSFLPYWKLPFAKHYLSNLQDFHRNMKLLNSILDELIVNAFATQNQADVAELENRGYSDTAGNSSLLRFLVDMRGEDTTSLQLRDDLMTMLIAGHETTAALLTWTLHELVQNPQLYARAQQEIDEVLGGAPPTFSDVARLPLLRKCFAETLRMYPQPPLLIRRALEDDTLPQGDAAATTFIPRGTDIFISTWSMHRSEQYWEHPDRYDPDRFSRPFPNRNPHSEWAGRKATDDSQLYPNEVSCDFAFLPFGGGSRKCIGDQFAMMESLATIALVLQQFEFERLDGHEVSMRTGL